MKHTLFESFNRKNARKAREVQYTKKYNLQTLRLVNQFIIQCRLVNKTDFDFAQSDGRPESRVIGKGCMHLTFKEDRAKLNDIDSFLQICLS